MPSANAIAVLAAGRDRGDRRARAVAADDEAGAEHEPADRLRGEAGRLEVELGEVEHRPAADSTKSPAIAVTMAVNITFTTAMSYR